MGGSSNKYLVADALSAQVEALTADNKRLRQALSDCAGLLEDVRNLHPQYEWAEKGIKTADAALKEATDGT